MPILTNEKIYANAADVETFIRYALDKQLVTVEKRYLDDTGKRFILDFYDTALLPGGQIKMRWGKAIQIAYSDLTEITLERVNSGDDEWYAKKFENFNRHIEKQLGRLEKLSDDILARFSQPARIDPSVADMSFGSLVGSSDRQQVDSSLTLFVREVEVLSEKSETQQIGAAKPERFDKENITWGELERLIEAGDKDAIELEEELSKELQPLLKESAIAIKQFAFTPLELAVYETFVKKDPTARVAIRKMTLGELKTLLPEIVRVQLIADPKPMDQSKVQVGAAKSDKSKQKRGAQLETEASLNRLREIRLEAITNNRPIPTRAAAMDEAGITDKTWKKYEPELWAHWGDKTYRQEKSE